jgi:predicted membrane-bound spermidine synthase
MVVGNLLFSLLIYLWLGVSILGGVVMGVVNLLSAVILVHISTYE